MSISSVLSLLQIAANVGDGEIGVEGLEDLPFRPLRKAVKEGVNDVRRGAVPLLDLLLLMRDESVGMYEDTYNCERFDSEP